MLARIALLALMTLGLLGLGGVAWISLNPAPTHTQTATSPNDTVSILVTARALRAGNLLKPEDLAAAMRPRKDIPAGAWTDTPSARAALLGAMIRRNMATGETLLPPDALNPGDRGFLAAVLTPGMRAVTVGVDAISGLSGLIWPGDRVDLILTQSQNRLDIPLSRRVSGETVLANVRVIAIDRQLVQGATSESPQGQTERTVTLEVTPADAERVAVAARLGQLSLAVLAAGSLPARADPGGRPLAASATPNASGGVTWGGDVSSALKGDTQPDAGTVRLFQGPSDSKEIHF